MNEFRKIDWRIRDLSSLEPQENFINEATLADSFLYKYLEEKKSFFPAHNKTNSFYKCFTAHHIPGSTKSFTYQKSMLNTVAHEKCLKALKILNSGKDPSNYSSSEKYYVELYHSLKSKILEENQLYQNFVHSQWLKITNKKLTKLKQRLISHGKSHWEAHWQKLILFPQYFTDLSTINMNFDPNDAIIDFVCVKNVLDVGKVARFSRPLLLSPYFLKDLSQKENDSNQTTCLSVPVNDDVYVKKILENHHEIDIVISLSGLKCLTDTTDLKRRWILPLTVKAVPIGNGGTKNVVFFNKPFNQYDMSNIDFMKISYTKLTKESFCKYEAFKYENKNVEATEIPPGWECCFSDENQKRNLREKNCTICHNASYRIWNIKKTYYYNGLKNCDLKPKEFNVLIRTKIDACELNDNGSLQPIIVNSKVESQLSYGATIPSKEELINEWTSLFFIPFSNLYRVRVSSNNSEVVNIEKCNIQKTIREAQTHHQFKPQIGLGVLQTVFETLINLPTGNYLLQHLPKHEGFIALLRACEQSVSENFNLHAEKDKTNLTENNWLPIDVNFILPSFEVAGRMPGMFTPPFQTCKKRKTVQDRNANKRKLDNK
ncbi:hypothetical protein ABEB36_012394 [Hypothenemus hampei]|uniref:Little elongation complex subunit 2 C-terminal domain-containing protein n=1 Tax=Hypothenemus hampei TaxID=57062 RepID=A0ABD1EB28_HYPHA